MTTKVQNMESSTNLRHNWTDIYYSTWSFENVAKNFQCQFLDPPPKLPVSVLRPPQILLPVSVFRPPRILLPVSVFRPPHPPKLPVSVLRPPKIMLPVSVFRPPPNIVKGNGVVFKNFTINNF